MVTVSATSRDQERFGAGLLRVALALRAEQTTDLDDVVRRTIEDMGLDDRAFRQYLADHLDALRTATAPTRKGTGRKQ